MEKYIYLRLEIWNYANAVYTHFLLGILTLMLYNINSLYNFVSWSPLRIRITDTARKIIRKYLGASLIYPHQKSHVCYKSFVILMVFDVQACSRVANMASHIPVYPSVLFELHMSISISWTNILCVWRNWPKFQWICILNGSLIVKNSVVAGFPSPAGSCHFNE